MFNKRDRNEVRVIRHARVRKKISGTPEMPRLCVYRSNKSIYAQVIDDTKGITLVSASTLDPQIKGQLEEVDKTGAAQLVGKLVAERALAAGIKDVTLKLYPELRHEILCETDRDMVFEDIHQWLCSKLPPQA